MRRYLWIGMMAVLLFLGWGWSQSPAIALPVDAAPPTVVEHVQQFLSQEAHLAPSQATIEQVEAVTWHDACLDLAQPGELCAQVLTPGYAIIVKTPKGTMALHTNQQGTSIRPESRAGESAPADIPMPPPLG